MIERRGHFLLEREDKAGCTGYLAAHRGLSYHGVEIGRVHWLICQKVEIGLDWLSFDSQHLERHPDVFRPHRDQDGRPVTLKQTSHPGSRGVVLGSYKDRA